MGSRQQRRRRNKQRRLLYALQSGRCFYCLRTMFPSEVTLDHIVPKCQGGGNDITNIVGSCSECNDWKGCYLVDEDWVAERINLFNCKGWEDRQ